MQKSILFFLFAAFLAGSNTLFSQVTLGVKGGLNLSKMLMKDDDDTYSSNFKMNPGFNVGVTGEFDITELFSFETGFMLNSKGFRDKQTIFGIESETKMNLIYLDIPLTAKATIEIGSLEIYGVAGPYVGFGLTGKQISKVSGNGNSSKDTYDIDWGSDAQKDDLKRLDFGVLAGAGIQLNGLQVGFTYGLGLANVSAYTDGGTTFKHNVLSFSVGYRFGQN